MDFDDMKASAEQTLKAAEELYRKDARVRAYIDSATAVALQEAHERIRDDEITARDVGEVANRAAALVASMILTNDNELVAARFERDHYKSLALKTLEAFPGAGLILPAQAGATRTGGDGFGSVAKP